jgi:hypothetical protein
VVDNKAHIVRLVFLLPIMKTGLASHLSFQGELEGAYIG